MYAATFNVKKFVIVIVPELAAPQGVITLNGPDVAPFGITAVIEVALLIV